MLTSSHKINGQNIFEQLLLIEIKYIYHQGGRGSRQADNDCEVNLSSSDGVARYKVPWRVTIIIKYVTY